MIRLVLLGPPGAGKGTHAKVLAQKYGAGHLATGDILRGHIREKTELGNKARKTIEGGGLVSDDLVNEVMFDAIGHLPAKSGFILDGYPRTIGQADALDKFLQKKKSGLNVVLNFKTSGEVINERLSGRRVCSECSANYHVRNMPPKVSGVCDQCGAKLIQRKDDQPETIRHRLEMYDRETLPLVRYYQNQKILQNIPGDYDVPELQEEISKLFDKLGLL